MTEEHMSTNDLQNLKGFTDNFAKEFVIPQIDLWRKNIDPKVKIGSGLMSEYYESMRNAVAELRKDFLPPYYSSFPLHDIVISNEKVEILKGIIGDNYNFFKKSIDGKKI